MFTDYQDLGSKMDLLRGSAIALGNFDGFHRGHQEILRTSIQEAKRQRIVSILFTFHPHPSKVLRPGGPSPEMILTEAEKMEMMLKMGFEAILNQNFSREFSLIEAEDFVQRVLTDSLKCQFLSVGENFRFGNLARGNISLLKSHGHFSIPGIPIVRIDDQPISSSMIRGLLRTGEISKANDALGYSYFISGIVMHGDGRGQKLGFPTANIESQKESRPAPGVYSGFLEFEGKLYLAAINCGYRPTFGGTNFLIEAHLIEENLNLYGEHVRVYFLEKIRNEQKFFDLSELQTQIQADIDLIKRETKKKVSFFKN